MRKVLGVVGGAVLLAGPALAADLGRPPPVYKAPPVPVFSWTGWYIGGNLGYGWGTNTDPVVTSNFATIGPGAFANLKPKGLIGGGQIGYDWQMSPNFVLGLVADFQGADIKDTGTVPVAFVIPGVVAIATTTTLSEKLDSLGTGRVRAGLTYNNWLFYGSGGVAYGNVKSTVDFGNVIDGSRSENRIGWAGGGGVNYAMTPNWIVGADYLHYDLGRTSVTGFDGVGAGASITASQKVGGDIIRGVINYKF